MASETLMFVASHLSRVLDTEERHLLQRLSAKGVAKLNRDQGAGVSLESTLADFKVAYRNFKERCAFMAESLNCEETLAHIPPIRSFSYSNGFSSSPLASREFFHRKIRHMSEHSLVMPSDVANLMRSMSASDLKQLKEKDVSEDELVDLALRLRDQSMRAHAESASRALASKVSVSLLVPTMTRTPPLVPSMSPPPSLATSALPVNTLESSNTTEETSPPDSPISPVAPLGPSFSSNSSLALSTLSAPSSQAPFPAGPTAVDGNDASQWPSTTKCSPKLPPLVSMPVAPFPQSQVFETPRGTHRKVVTDPSESWFELHTPRASPSNKVVLSPILSPHQAPQGSPVLPLDLNLDDRRSSRSSTQTTTSILKPRSGSVRPLPQDPASTDQPQILRRRRSHSGPPAATRFGTVTVREIPRRPATPVTVTVPVWLLEGPTGSAVRVALEGKRKEKSGSKKPESPSEPPSDELEESPKGKECKTASCGVVSGNNPHQQPPARLSIFRRKLKGLFV